MNDYIVAEFVDSVNSVINCPIQLTQRIKYTSWDVSENYIIFGANSGGLYIFKRHPCCFLKLIPSAEGAVIHVCISSDEKITAIGTAKGTICLVHNAESLSKDIEVYNVHLGNLITAMKWNSNGNEIYTGDDSGRISVVVVTNFITKTMFQTPCATLMQLDSKIVQLDWCSNFLLVSTLTRSYLCDTVREYYTQIGKKLRDGEYGACFFGSRENVDSSDRKPEISTFRILSDKEAFMTDDGEDNLHIFCARPGLRLWEVKLSGTVVRTHQFKEALAVEPNNILAITDDTESRLNIYEPDFITKVNSVNFIKLFVLDNQFIVTFQKCGLFIIDTSNVAIIFWTNLYSDIVNVKVVNNIIYLWTVKNKMHVLLFSSLESFVLKCLSNKKYLLCADLCIAYQKQLKHLVLSSRRLHLLITLKDKLYERNEVLLREKCEPLFELIRLNSKEKPIAQRLPSGIFLIDNAYNVSNPIEEGMQIVKTDEDNSTSDLDQEIIDITLKLNKGTDIFLGNIRDADLENKKYNLMYEDYELQKVNKLYRTHMAEEILDQCSSVTHVIDTFEEFKNDVRILQPQEDKIQEWCYEKCLEYLETKIGTNFFASSTTCDKYLLDAYQYVNFTTENACKCGFPLPTAKEIIPAFPKIGTYLAEVLWKTNTEKLISLCRKVPYMWKAFLRLSCDEDIRKLLALILQYGDVDLFDVFINQFTYDIWNETLEKFILLRNGVCLNCEQVFCDGNLKMSWKDLAMKMVKCVGAESAVYLLSQKANDIPSSELDMNFYQCAIFATIIDKVDSNLREKAIDLVAGANKNEELNYLGKLLEKSVLQPKTVIPPDPTKLSTEVVPQCSYCKLPLTVPVLSKEKTRRLDCGHVSHSFCLNIQKDFCKLCTISKTLGKK